MKPARSEREEGGISPEVPHLSHSRINRYLHCPEQYRLYYIENLRPRLTAANLVFGQVVHQALARFFKAKTDPVTSFEDSWDQLRRIELAYGAYDSWEKLAASGETLLRMFVAEEAPRLDAIDAIEEGFALTVTTLGIPFVGVIDLVAHLDKRRTVIDFKTAAKAYEEHTVLLSDQLTVYVLARPDAEQVALCVFVKSKVPRIEWHVTERKPAQIAEYLRKAELVGQALMARHFYKRPGWWCSSCDYLPVCLGDQKKVRETLVQAAPRRAA
jgi:RecB family exonuclease